MSFRKVLLYDKMESKPIIIQQSDRMSNGEIVTKPKLVDSSIQVDLEPMETESHDMSKRLIKPESATVQPLYDTRIDGNHLHEFVKRCGRKQRKTVRQQLKSNKVIDKTKPKIRAIKDNRISKWIY